MTGSGAEARRAQGAATKRSWTAREEPHRQEITELTLLSGLAD
jgi:hypothetical protein